eukprot:TRINITY_DN9618_c0_g1_i2.p1 TRINITY_DN9618_c0_g1~~TRINITY_DN9618_c0_g1_i2.p1  ORF type:complete len:201 (+),score=28.53 TRINITY_DN9618_c0_g1_i2:268-870(+)
MKIPDGDILIHAGDMLLESRGADRASLESLADFNSWMSELPHTSKLVVAGNHDGALLDMGKEASQKMLTSCKYLQDETVEVAGIKIHGSPLSTGHSSNSAFQEQGGYDEVGVLAAMPEGLDVLITHGPAGSGDSALGRASLRLEECRSRIRPRLHIFGHYHLGHGVSESHDRITLVNASSADLFFAVTNPPIVIDLHRRF